MADLAESYVRVVLALGEHDPSYVDAYYGPPEWRAEVRAEAAPLGAIADRIAGLLTAYDHAAVATPQDASRFAFMRGQLVAAACRVRQLQGQQVSFDEESRALYDAVAPSHPDEYFARIIDELERVVPGTGPLIERVERFRSQFLIPADRLAEVFAVAVAESRRRTLERVTLPAEERFTLEYVTGKPWSGYNWYQGGYVSVIQVNTDFPVYLERVLDLAAHEGYPGHHLYNVLLERELVRGRGWTEFTVYPLFSPQSLIAEGTANMGIELAFPDEERRRFTHDVLMPMAGLPVSGADRYEAFIRAMARLSYAGNEAARRYLDGRVDREGAVDWLTRYALMAPARAEQRTRFFDVFRSYVINYNLGQDLVRTYLESRGGTPDQPGRRWDVFLDLLQSPRLPSGLS